MSFKIVTCCNRIPSEPYYCLTEFVKSLGDDVEKLLVLHEEYMGTWDGLGSKPKWVYKAIKEGLIKEKYIVFCDCWDLVFTVTPTHLFNLYYLNMNSPLVFSCEKNCFPNDLKDEYDKLPFIASSYKYLNSGMIVGETAAMLAVLEAMDLDNVPNDYRKENGQMEHINDQFLYQQIFLKQPVRMQLDYRQLLCNTLHSVKLDELDFSRPWIKNVETGMYPGSFHFNGSSKTDGLREPILKYLGL